MNIRRVLRWALFGLAIILGSAGIMWGREVASWRPLRIGKSLPNATFVLSPSGRYLASSIDKPLTQLIDLETGKVVLERASNQRFAELDIETCVFSRDSKRVAFVRQREWIDVKAEAMLRGPLTVEVLALPSLKRLSSFQLKDAWWRTFRVSPQFEEAMSLGYNDDYVWNLKNGRLKGKLLLHPGYRIDSEQWNFSPDGSLLMLKSDATALYRTSDGNRLETFPPDAISSDHVEVSPDNSLVAESNSHLENGPIHSRFMRARTGRVLWSAASSVFAFFSDSQRVAVVEGARINVKEASTGTTIRSLVAPSQETLTWIAWTPDGNFVYVAAQSGTLWRLRAR